MKFADLHVHTLYSDSTFSPEEVVAYAHQRGLSAIAICDHDTIDGIGPCTKLAKKHSLEIIPGIELTVEKTGAEIHILGYFLDWKQAWLKKQLKEMQEHRVDRLHKMIEKLAKEGIDVEAKEVLKLSDVGSVGRLHLARIMLKTGKVKTFKEAFGKYLGFAKPCYVSNIRFSPKEAIEMVLRAGGVPVFAHPRITNRDDHIPELMGYGLRGIEVYHTDHDARAVKHYEELAAQYGLLVTGGSDCHGLGKGRALIGEVRVPYDLVEKLKSESDKIRKL